MSTPDGYQQPDPYGAQPIRPRQPREASNPNLPRFFGWVLIAFGIVLLLSGIGDVVTALLTQAAFSAVPTIDNVAVSSTTDLVTWGFVASSVIFGGLGLLLLLGGIALVRRKQAAPVS